MKLALEQLLDAPCYHMLEAFERPEDTPVWHAAARGEPVDWDRFLPEFVAIVDWPGAAFWSELRAAHPDAVVLLSTRSSSEAWWESMEQTIVPTLSQPVPAGDPDRAQRRAMIVEMLERRFDPRWQDRDAAIAAYERHNAEVRAAVPAEQLVDWEPGDGWEPICAALELPTPAEPFPHTNTAQEFRSEQELEDE